MSDSLTPGRSNILVNGNDRVSINETHAVSPLEPLDPHRLRDMVVDRQANGSHSLQGNWSSPSQQTPQVNSSPANNRTPGSNVQSPMSVQPQRSSTGFSDHPAASTPVMGMNPQIQQQQQNSPFAVPMGYNPQQQQQEMAYAASPASQRMATPHDVGMIGYPYQGQMMYPQSGTVGPPPPSAVLPAQPLGPSAGPASTTQSTPNTTPTSKQKGSKAQQTAAAAALAQQQQQQQAQFQKQQQVQMVQGFTPSTVVQMGRHPMQQGQYAASMYAGGGSVGPQGMVGFSPGYVGGYPPGQALQQQLQYSQPRLVPSANPNLSDQQQASGQTVAMHVRPSPPSHLTGYPTAGAAAGGQPSANALQQQPSTPIIQSPVNSMPFAAETLFDVLSFLNRLQLDALAAVNSYLNAFLCKHFPIYPFNCINELCIETEENSFRKKIAAIYADSSLEELQKLANSRKWVVKWTLLDVNHPGFVAAEWKSKLESISSLWQGSTLKLRVSNSPAILREIFTWSNVFTCSHFQLIILSNSRVIFPFNTFPLLYTFSKMEFSSGDLNNIRPKDLLTYLENIPKDRQHNLSVSWVCHRWDTGDDLLDLAEKIFSAAESQCPFHLQIHTVINSFADRHFQVTNPVTRECLQFYLEEPDKHILVFVLKRSSL